MTKKNINLYSPRQPPSRPVLHRARLVVPISQPAIEDGAVVVADGVILDVGPFRLLHHQWLEAPEQDHGETALLPALVNAHAHLALSGLAGQVPAQGSMTEWIRTLLVRKEQGDKDHMDRAHVQALNSLHAFGIGIIGDINASGEVPASDGTVIMRTFVEIFGLSIDSFEDALGSVPPTIRKVLADGQENVSLAVHAPYTTSAALIRHIKNWGTVRAKVISVHAAESEEEILFLRTGRGPLRDLLEERGHEPDTWEAPGCGSVTYLNRLGVLDSRTLCVHVVQVSDAEIKLLRDSGSGVCLCPRSNLFIGNGLPPVTKLLQAHISCALGTDSLASNTDLNLFEEMNVLMERCSISPDVGLAMATLHGARNLGVGSTYGSLEKGKKWFAIRVAATDSEGIVEAGRRGDVQWVK